MGTPTSLVLSNNVLHYTLDDALSPNMESVLHFDGSSGSTAIADATGRHIWTTSSGAQLDNTQSKFGGTSLRTNGGGATGDGTIVFGTNDFTIDFWVMRNGAQGQNNLVDIVNFNSVIYFNASGKLALFLASDQIVGTTTVTDNVWHHVALTRQGGIQYLFLDGVLQGTWNTGSAYNYGTAGSGYPVFVEAGLSLNGWVDEFRILIGSAAWTSNFTVPSSAYVVTGVSVADSSGNSNTGLLHGTGTTSAPGQIGQAIAFNGSGSVGFTSVSQLGLASPASAFSASFWIKTTQTDSNILTIRGSAGGGLGLIMVGLGQIAGGNAGTGFPFVVTQGDNGSGFGTFGGSSTTVSASDGNWHHLAFTRTTGQVITIYLDNAVLATVGDALSGAGVTPVLANSAIGFDPISNASYFNGLLDDFQIYNRALTSTEVSSIYNSGLGNVGSLLQISATFAGAGSLTSRLALPGKLVATFAGAGALTATMSLPTNKTSLASTYAGSGAFVSPTAQLRQALTALIPGTGAITAAPIQLRTLGAAFTGGGAIIPPNLTQAGIPTSRQLAASFAGSGGFNNPWYLAYVKAIHYPARLSIGAIFAGEGTVLVTVPPASYNIYMTTDKVNPGIYPLAGSDVLYRQAAGLEKAMADVDAGRLIATYAELVRDQWDPWAISYRNLGYLAWAMGVNLWEDDWSEPQRRQWVANQWTFKYYRGSDLGMKMAIESVNAKIKNIVRPPALFMPGSQVGDAQAALLFLVPNAQYREGIVGDETKVGTKQWYNNLVWLDSRKQPTWTDIVNADRRLYNQRFPQLRLYPYAPRPQLPWLNYLGGKSYDSAGNPIPVKNGFYFGPYQRFYPTNFNAGGLYLRKCTLYEPRTGVETQLTVRTIRAAPAKGMPVTTFDEIQLPINPGNLFFPGENKQYLFPRNVSLAITRRHAVVLGKLPFEGNRLIRIPRDGTLSITQYQAIFSTVVPSLKPINVSPELVSVVHPMRPTEFYCGQTLRKKFMPKSNAWQYLYERWYLFDPTRQPDQRWARVYMGRARFGIPKYSAKVKVDAPFHWPHTYARAGGFIGKGWYFPPKNTKRIDQVRRAVTAAMALRDTVQIDTKVKRMTQLRDITLLDGTFSFGEYLTDSW